MENITIDFLGLSALVGAFLPLVTQLVKNIGGEWPVLAKQAAALVLALVAGVLQVGIAEGWDLVSLSTVLAAWGTIYAIAQTSYQNFWGNEKLGAVQKLGQLGAGS